MNGIIAFFAGVFIANGTPHFIKGITGQTFMTPFKRVSNSYLNVLWGVGNFLLALIIMGTSPATGQVNLPGGMNVWVFMVGVIFMSLVDAWLFSKPNARFPWHRD